MVSGIKLVILDYDLTLIDNIIDFYDSFNEALHKYTGGTVDYSVFVGKLVSDSLNDILPQHVDRDCFWREMRSRICSSKASYYVDNYTRLFLYLTKLMNMKNIIVSGKNCHKQYIVNDLIRNNIIDYIDDVYTFLDLEILNGVEEVLFDKSWLLKYVIDKHGFEASEVVFIGDYYMDYISSLKTGTLFIGLTSNEYRYCFFRKLGARYIARNFLEAFLHLLDLTKRTGAV